jgi:hypothetical protein
MCKTFAAPFASRVQRSAVAVSRCLSTAHYHSGRPPPAWAPRVLPIAVHFDKPDFFLFYIFLSSSLQKYMVRKNLQKLCAAVGIQSLFKICNFLFELG